MLFFFCGTDHDKVRAALHKELALYEKKGYSVVRVTDAHMVEDVSAALRGGGMFDGPRVVVFENVLTNEEMEPLLHKELVALGESEEPYVILEEKVDAATRKLIEKHAEKSERFDSPKEYDSKEAFALANALQRQDKKGLWVGLMREYAKGSAPEMLHGILFWAAKQQLLRGSRDVHVRGLVAALAELPHQARRQGFDLEYALEHFVLSEA